MNRETVSSDATISVELFLDRLDQSSLIGEQRLSEIRQATRTLSRTIRTPALARRLVNEGLLTEWQQRMLLEGRTAFFLGKYKLLHPIGQGGMGIVFKAEHATMGRTVAIKVLPKRGLTNSAVVARFYREIQAAAQLHDPHVVVAYDADRVGDMHFLVMEYVEGEDLQSVLDRRGKFFPEEACEYVRQAALGLQHAHEKGLVHRDLKPGNLMLTLTPRKEPVVKILDMGLAKFVRDAEDIQPSGPGSEGGDRLTRVGQVMGTPDYMAPEQAWNLKAADIRSDIYSLGCTLFEFLTGRLPYCGESVTQKVLVRSVVDAPSARSFDPDIPAALDTVLARMLARDPKDRFQTPAEVAEALEPFCVLPEGVLRVAPEQTAPATPASTESEQASGTIDPALQQLLNELDKQSSAVRPTRKRTKRSRRSTVLDDRSDDVRQFLQTLGPRPSEDGPLNERTETGSAVATEHSGHVSDLIHDCLTQHPTEDALLSGIRRRKTTDRTKLVVVMAVAIVAALIIAAAQWLM